MRRFLFLFPLLLLAACYDTPAPQNFTPYRYGAPLGLNVSTINVIKEVDAPTGGAERDFPITPEDALRAWVSARLKAQGAEHRMDIIIKEASAKETILPTKQGIEGAFTNEANKRIDARIEVELRIYTGKPLADASVNVVASRSQTLSENASLAERNRLLYELTQKLMADVDASLERNIRSHFANYMVTR